MSEDGIITSKKGNTIDYLKSSPSLYLDKTIALYGDSNTGKSVFIRMILKSLKDHVPYGIVFNGTENGGEGSYANLFPKSHVYNYVDIDVLSNIKEHQAARTTIFNEANKFDTLERLYSKIRNYRSDEKINKFKSLTKKARRKIKDRHKLKEFDKNTKDKLKKQYKFFIRKNYKKIRYNRLQKDEKYAIKYINLNPHVLVIFDDVGDTFNALYKKNKELIGQMFTRDRHSHITYVFAFQFQDQLHADLRKNVAMSIFTTETTLNEFVRKESNNLKQTQKYIFDVAPLVYNKPGFYRIVRLRLEGKYKYIKSVNFDEEDCKFCDKEFYKYYRRIKKKNEDIIDQNNKFYSMFNV